MDNELKGIVGGAGLGILYSALQEHKEFWAKWIDVRIGPMADFFAPAPEEQEAAKALGDALLKLGEGFKILEDA